MALTTQQKLNWLQSQSERVILAEIGYNDNVSDGVMRIASRSYISKPIDTVPNAAYLGIIKAVPSFSADASGRLNIGNLDIRNNGEYDDWLDWNWGNRTVRIGLGDPSWSLDDFIFTTLQTTKQGMTAPNLDTLRLFFSDTLELLNNPVQTNLLPNNNPKPLAFGTVFNATPAFLEATGGASYYQVNDGAIHALTVRGGGLSVAGVTNDLANGKFSINPSPSSKITCDITQKSTTQTIVDLVEQVITRLGESARIDAANFAAYKLLYPYESGYYVSTRTNALKLIQDALSDQLVLSADIAGQFYFWRRGVKTGNETTIYADYRGFIAERGVSVSVASPPIAKIRLGYKANNTVQSDSELFAGVGAADRDIYGRESQTVSSEQTIANSAEALEYPEFPPLSLQTEEGSGNEIATRLALYAKPVKQYTIQSFIDPVTVRLGDTMVLTYPRFGFDAGREMQIVGYNWNPLMRKCAFELAEFLVDLS